MSTQFNNQWILDRAEHGHGAAYAPAEEETEQDTGGEADALVARDMPPVRRHPRPRASRADSLSKRPKWIDRDT